MKRQYIKPAMQVVKLQHQCQILAGSYGVNGLSEETQENYGITWQEEGFDDSDEDY